MTQEQNRRAQLLRSYHEAGGPVLVLPNAWDAASATAVAAAGAQAVATTSAGVAWSLGRPDGQRLTQAEAVAVVERIAAAVDIPVTADIEAGYGPTPRDVAGTVAAVARAGAVGVNLEDSTAPGGPLFPVAEQVERIRAARDAARAAGVADLVVNARTDGHLFQLGDPAGRLAQTLARAEAYATAGADCLFVPGLSDLADLGHLAASSPLPVNAMAEPGGPTVTELGAAGVRRISVGPWLAQACYTLVEHASAELLTTGTYERLAGSVDFSILDGRFRR